MYLFLQCEITVGKFTFKSVHEGEIRSSWRDLTDTAVLTIPRNLSYAKAGSALKDTKLDRDIPRGSKVVVKLGYNGNLTTEFQGYVREVEPNEPVKIYCEDEMMMLKKGRITKTWKNAKLSTIINDIMPKGYTMKVANASGISLAVRDLTPALVLLELREYGIYSFFRTDASGKVFFYSGFPYDVDFNKITYHMQKNVRENDLKFRMGGVDVNNDEATIQIKAVAHLPNGKRTIVYYPHEDMQGAEVKTLPFPELSENETERKKLLSQYAEQEFKKFNVDGYRGSLTGFAVPIPRHGDHVTVIDARYPERQGTYIVDQAVTSFGEVYLKRKIELGPKVSA